MTRFEPVRRSKTTGILGWMVMGGMTLTVWNVALAERGHAQLLPAKSAESVRQVLDIYGLDAAFFDRFAVDKPLAESEQPQLWKLLMRLGEMRRLDLERWARDADPWPQFVADPQAHRGQLCRVLGTATSIELVPLDDETAARFNLPQVLRVELLTADGAVATIYTTAAPKAWKPGELLDEPASAIAMLVKRETPPGEKPGLLLVADRVAWHPDTLLGNLGMDVGLLDTVEQRRALLPAERECFYQLLAAAERSKPHQLEAEAFEQLRQLAKASPTDDAKPGTDRQRTRARQQLYDVVPLFNDPASQVGRLVMLEGDALRAVEILVDDPDIVERLGIRKYYEIAMFTDDSQRNPLVCCVLDVPKDMPLGDDISAKVRVAGFFLKSWAYPQAALAQGPQTQPPKQQLTPLIIGRDLRMVVVATSTLDIVGSVVLIGVLLLIMGGILFAALRTGRSSTVPPASDAAPPDFSGLEQ